MKKIGEIRRSQLVGTYGPGAVVDFRAPSGAPISGLVSGLEEWDRAAGSKSGLNHPQSIHEPRLQKKFGVGGFRLPPIRAENLKDEDDRDRLPIVRFPDWLQCPRCGRLARSSDWKKDPGGPERWCPGKECMDGEKVYAVPVRFIVACEDGHLDEFPWKRWIGCRCEKPRLFLKTVAPGLSGKLVECRKKGCQSKPRSLEGVFLKKTLEFIGMDCRGRTPWLAQKPKPCQRTPRVLQRGASNVYWGATASALDIPPFSHDLSPVFGKYWDDIKDAEPEKWRTLIEILNLDQKTGQPAEVILQMLHTWKDALGGRPVDEPLEWGEYKQFRGSAEGGIDQRHFRTRPEPVPLELGEWVNEVILAQRLREVRVLVGFTRIHPPSGPSAEATQRRGRISAKPITWYPAVELRGEGIFLDFDTPALHEWESSESVVKRIELLNKSVEDDRWDEEELPPITPRMVMIHTLAHALMRQLSLKCGYGSTALRERLYVGTGKYNMAGLLIHTGTPDSEGTLGGLVRQGRTDDLWDTMLGALQSMSWCSSDPLCATGAMTLSSPRNLSACHACVLVPETSCLHFNTLLDRALLVGTPKQPELGFFRDLLDQYT